MKSVKNFLNGEEQLQVQKRVIKQTNIETKNHGTIFTKSTSFCTMLTKMKAKAINIHI